MKRKKNFTVAKILLILIGCLSCLGTVLISQTLSTYYTSYSFINEFRTPTSEDSNSCSISVYRVGSPPETIVENDEYPCAFHIKNEGTVAQYIRVALPAKCISDGIATENLYSAYSLVYNGCLSFFDWTSNGMFAISDDFIVSNTDKWIDKRPWLYLKKVISPTEDIQLTTNFDCSNVSGVSAEMYYKLIVEALPADADEDEFQSAWGVSKYELQDLGLDQEETAS